VRARAVGDRLHSLDGLRGIAALVVVLDHCMLVVPSVIRHHLGQPAPRGSVLWFVMSTPLSLYWAGAQAVFVFFVLSGFVLIRMSESARFTWRAYYPSRLLRLYLPVFGALAFAEIAVVAFARHPIRGEPWLNMWAHPHLHELPADAFLLRGTQALLPPLWSLKWEVIFSLLLPLAVYFAARAPRRGAVQVVVLLAITCFGTETSGGRGYFLYLPMFGVGAVMARNRDALHRAGSRLGPAVGSGFLIGAVILTSGAWTRHVATAGVTRASQVAGAGLLVFLCAYWNPFRHVAESPVAQWLGKRSFSLYLVHFSIVVTTAFLLGRHAGLTFLIAIPVSLLAADLFFRAWEGPSHRISQAVRRALAAAEPVPRRPVGSA
jgi:peptidoglycan/LPS O-acetylase OafA/YrhL